MMCSRVLIECTTVFGLEVLVCNKNRVLKLRDLARTANGSRVLWGGGGNSPPVLVLHHRRARLAVPCTAVLLISRR